MAKSKSGKWELDYRVYEPGDTKPYHSGTAFCESEAEVKKQWQNLKRAHAPFRRRLTGIMHPPEGLVSQLF